MAVPVKPAPIMAKMWLIDYFWDYLGFIIYSKLRSFNTAPLALQLENIENLQKSPKIKKVKIA
jgi:hypothetical protein